MINEKIMAQWMSWDGSAGKGTYRQSMTGLVLKTHKLRELGLTGCHLTFAQNYVGTDTNKRIIS